MFHIEKEEVTDFTFQTKQYPASIKEGVDTFSDWVRKVLKICYCQRPPTQDHQEHPCS